MVQDFLKAASVLALLIAAPSAQAAMRPQAVPAAPVQRISGGCAPGYHRDVSGFCVDSMDYKRICPAGLFALPFPNGNGFRCAPADWLGSSGWLGDFFPPN